MATPCMRARRRSSRLDLWLTLHRETTSIPTNPRTTRPVGYAFVDLSTAAEAQKAIEELSGRTIVDRKVSVQVARKPETAAEKQAAASSGAEGEGAEGGRRRASGRGRGRGRGRGGRAGRGGREVSHPPSLHRRRFQNRMRLLQHRLLVHRVLR